MNPQYRILLALAFSLQAHAAKLAVSDTPEWRQHDLTEGAAEVAGFTKNVHLDRNAIRAFVHKKSPTDLPATVYLYKLEVPAGARLLGKSEDWRNLLFKSGTEKLLITKEETAQSGDAWIYHAEYKVSIGTEDMLHSTLKASRVGTDVYVMVYEAHVKNYQLNLTAVRKLFKSTKINASGT